MEKEALKRIFEFLEEKGEHIIPLPVKIKLAMPIAKEDLNVKGDLSLSNSGITSLPKGLEVGGDLYLREVDLEKYSDKELREMIKPGFIKGKIDRDYEDDNEDDDN